MTEFFKKNKTDLFLIALLFLMVGFIYHGWFNPGIIAKGDLRSWSNIALKEFVGPPSAWLTYEGGGYYYLVNGLQIIHYPFLLFQGLVSVMFNTDFAVAERITLFYPFLFFAVVGMYRLSDYLFKNKVINFFSTLFFLLNPLTLNYAYFAHIVGMILVYALLPWVILFYIKSLNAITFKEKVRYAILTGAIFSCGFYTDIKIGYLTFASLMALFLYYTFVDILKNKQVFWKNLRKHLSASVLMGLTILILNLFWIIPYILVPPKTALFQIEAFNLDKIDDLFSLLRAFTFYFTDFNLSFLPLVITSVISLSAFVFMGKANSKYRPILIFFALWVLFSTFLYKSGSQPFPEIFVWMYKYLPGFKAFREPSKIGFVSVLPRAFLFGFAVFSITELAKKKLFNFQTGQKISQGIIFSVVVVLLFSNLSWLIKYYPLADGEGTLKYISTFEPEKVSAENLQMEKFFAGDEDKFRILYFPTDPAYGVLNRKHTAIYSPDIAPVTNSFLTYMLGWRWYPPGLFAQNKTVDFGKLLSLKNIKYVVYLPQSDFFFRASNEKDEAARLLTILKKQKDLERVDLGEYVYVFLNKAFEKNKSIFLTQNSYLVNGGLDALASRNVLALDFNNSVFFSPGNHKGKILTHDFEFKNVIQHQQSSFDLALSTLPSEYFFDAWPYAQLPATGYSNDKKGGFYQQYENEANLANVYGKIPLSHYGLVKGADGALSIPVTVKKSGEYEVWMRLGLVSASDIYATPKSDDFNDLVEFRVNNKLLEHDDVNLTSVNNLQWVRLFVADLHDLQNQFTVEFANNDPDKKRALVVDQVAVIPPQVVSEQMSNVETWLANKNSISPENDLNTNAAVAPELPLNVKEISPSNYKVSFKIDGPTYLVFQDNYDPYWELDLGGKKFQPLETITGNMSFYIDSPGNYDGDLKFIPQKYTDIGFSIFVFGWLIVIILEICLAIKIMKNHA